MDVLLKNVRLLISLYSNICFQFPFFFDIHIINSCMFLSIFKLHLSTNSRNLSVCGRHISRTVHLIIFALGICNVKGPRKCRIARADVIAFLKLGYSKLWLAAIVQCFNRREYFFKIVTFRLDDCPLVVEWQAQMEAQASSTWVLLSWLSPSLIWQDFHVTCYSLNK